jgi:replication-associated recombination protein RarA
MKMDKEKPDSSIKQVDLSGGRIVKPDRSEVALEKSALQKYIRRGIIEKSMFWAWKMSTVETGWSLWRRLNIIAVEDVLDPVVILAVAELGKQASRYGYGEWDGKRCAVAAAKIMAESEKDRSADEFLEVMDFCFKHHDDEDCRKRISKLGELDDYVFDVHTPQGRKMRRGDEYWYMESSRMENPSQKYIRFNDFLRSKMRKGEDGRNDEG